MKKSFRTKVFAWAYEIARTTGKCFSVCLTKAWALYRIIKAMKSGVASFAYRKTDGTTRKAKGTLANIQEQIKGTGKPKAGVMPYFDVESNAFRSFKIENLLTD